VTVSLLEFEVVLLGLLVPADVPYKVATAERWETGMVCRQDNWRRDLRRTVSHRRQR
jgi:hypothetical protein